MTDAPTISLYRGLSYSSLSSKYVISYIMNFIISKINPQRNDNITVYTQIIANFSNLESYILFSKANDYFLRTKKMLCLANWRAVIHRSKNILPVYINSNCLQNGSDLEKSRIIIRIFVQMQRKYVIYTIQLQLLQDFNFFSS